MWGGGGSGVDYDVMEVYHLPTGAWDQKPTTGTPPPGTRGYSSVAIGKDIYYFGGREVDDQNSLHSFNVDSFKWRQLSPSSSDHGPMKKAYSGMLSVNFDNEDYLVMIGGYALSPINPPKQPDAQYTAGGRCNEIHYYRISSDQWISPVVTGDRPPPIEDFTLTPVTNNTAVMFGGSTDNGVSNKLYMISFTKTSVDILEVPNPGGSVQWPKGRYAHSSVLITTSSGPHLLVVGGSPAYDVWLLDINKRKWKELIYLPDNVTNRYWHSLSVWNVTPTTNWIIEFGGFTSYIANTAVIELRYTSDNDWSTSVIPLVQYQDQLRRRILSDWEYLGLSKEVQLLRGHLQEREREFYEEQLQREIKEKEQIQQDRDKEQQQFLLEKATLSHQLDDATTLLEQAEKDKSTVELEYNEKLKVKDAEILEIKTQVEEKKQIITEDYEKLKLKVVDMEEQYLKEKQIIFG
uniref:Galactose oxidase n=1 Tax=Amphimedon queenslandica TaxID=400682 RepID=A0A1X7U8D7_AMPQE